MIITDMAQSLRDIATGIGADRTIRRRSTHAEDCPTPAVSNTRRDRLCWWKHDVRSAVCATTAYISMRPDGILQ